MERADSGASNLGYMSGCRDLIVCLDQQRATGEWMSKVKIKVARIEEVGDSRAGPQVCITFAIDCGTVHFRVPVRVDVSDFDNTEVVQAARSSLHRTFVELAAQTQRWELSVNELRLLSDMSLRAKR